MQAHFQNIQPYLLEALQKAERKISVAVAWFTDFQIFSLLTEKAEKGVEIMIFLVDDHINKSINGLPFASLQNKGAKIFWTNPQERLMHHKFCVIDGKILCFGSYNWTNKAHFENVENMVITEDTALITSFEVEFKRLFQLYNLQTAFITKEIALEQNVVWLKILIKILEEQNIVLTTEINHWEMIIHQFNLALQQYVYQEYVSLQELKLKIAEKKAKLTQKKEDFEIFEQQQKDFQNFKIGHQEKKSPINIENKEDNKKLYREIVKLCHPDKVEEKYKVEANIVFDKAKNALDNQDTNTLKDLLKELEQGIAFEIDIENIDNKSKLNALHQKLLNNYQTLTQKIQSIQQKQEYSLIKQYDKNWQTYFEQIKESLKNEIIQLKKNYKI